MLGKRASVTRIGRLGLIATKTIYTGCEYLPCVFPIEAVTIVVGLGHPILQHELVALTCPLAAVVGLDEHDLRSVGHESREPLHELGFTIDWETSAQSALRIGHIVVVEFDDH